MKRAVILHGTGNNPTEGWHPWLNQVLVEHGFTVLHPELPDSTKPNRHTYNEFLFAQDWDFEDNVLFGHSSGATAILNFLMDERSPRIKAAVLLAAFLELSPAILASDWYIPGQFDETFPPTGFDWNLIQSKCQKLYFVHGDNDPICSYELTQQTAEKVDGKLITITGGQHLGNTSGVTELPQMMQLLESDAII